MVDQQSAVTEPQRLPPGYRIRVLPEEAAIAICRGCLRGASRREDRRSADDILELLGELRVRRQLERADAMRRELVGFEDKLYRTPAHSRRLC
jgi:hypothetical protein